MSRDQSLLFICDRLPLQANSFVAMELGPFPPQLGTPRPWQGYVLPSKLPVTVNTDQADEGVAAEIDDRSVLTSLIQNSCPVIIQPATHVSELPVFIAPDCSYMPCRHRLLVRLLIDSVAGTPDFEAYVRAMRRRQASVWETLARIPGITNPVPEFTATENVLVNTARHSPVGQNSQFPVTFQHRGAAVPAVCRLGASVEGAVFHAEFYCSRWVDRIDSGVIFRRRVLVDSPRSPDVIESDVCVGVNDAALPLSLRRGG
jgi:hypothetical protein